MTNEQIVNEAIAKSNNSGEIVKVAITGESVESVMCDCFSSGDWDYAQENDGTYDVYSIGDDRYSAFRLNITVE